MIRNYSQLADLFSISFLNKTIENKHIPYLKGVLVETNFHTSIDKNIPLKSILSKVFKYLNKSYRCEYVFKTAILKEILRRHDFYSTTYLTEFRALNTKADIVILNGSSTVYEIKSDIDNFSRLSNQLSVYQRMFDNVYVVSNSENVEKLEETVPDNIGILTLNRNLSLNTHRKAKSNINQFDKSLIFDALRKTDYLPIINDAFGYIPKVPNTSIHAKCNELFTTLTNRQAHTYFIDALKNRRLSNKQISLVNKSNLSLKALLSEKSISNVECQLINIALNQTIKI